MERLRPNREVAKSVARKVDEMFGQEDAVPLTADVVAHLTSTSPGLAGVKSSLLSQPGRGAHYSPSGDPFFFRQSLKADCTNYGVLKHTDYGVLSSVLDGTP